MGFYLFHFFSTHFLQWLVEKNNYISMHKLPIICLGQQSLIFNLRLWFWEVFLSFLWWLLHCVTVDIPIFSFFPFLSHSRTLLFYSLWSLHFLQTCQISEWNEKKNVDGFTGNQGMIIKWAELWIKLKICTLKID